MPTAGVCETETAALRLALVRGTSRARRAACTACFSDRVHSPQTAACPRTTVSLCANPLIQRRRDSRSPVSQCANQPIRQSLRSVIPTSIAPASMQRQTKSPPLPQPPESSQQTMCASAAALDFRFFAENPRLAQIAARRALRRFSVVRDSRFPPRKTCMRADVRRTPSAPRQGVRHQQMRPVHRAPIRRGNVHTPYFTQNLVRPSPLYLAIHSAARAWHAPVATSPFPRESRAHPQFPGTAFPPHPQAAALRGRERPVFRSLPESRPDSRARTKSSPAFRASLPPVHSLTLLHLPARSSATPPIPSAYSEMYSAKCEKSTPENSSPLETTETLSAPWHTFP